MATLAEIRAKLKAQDEAKNQRSSSGDNTIFPHWNIDEGQSAKVRFLPDADPNNTFFWVERLQINLPFAGIKGQPNSKPCTVKVPCMEMWEPVGSCPILSEVRPWFKNPELEETARSYWKKRSYLMQGFVHESPLDEEVPENPIRRFIFTPQIFEMIKAAIMDPELEELPTDYQMGLDFIINKTKKPNGYADYTTSKWARRESALTQEELDAIEEYGLFNLADFLPKKPDQEHLRIIYEMFEASVDGEAYDPDRWAGFYRPPGVDDPNYTSKQESKQSDTSAKKASPTPTEKVEEKAEEPVVDQSEEKADSAPEKKAEPKKATKTVSDDDKSAKAKAIMEMVRKRKNA